MNTTKIQIIIIHCFGKKKKDVNIKTKMMINILEMKPFLNK